MKAIILRAWEGSRLRPITDTTPKPMIKIFWKPILEHNIESIYNLVSEIIIIIKYKKDIITSYFWDNYKNTKITYIIQNDDKWTARAIRWISWIDEDVIIMNWDSIFFKEDLLSILKLDWYWALVQKVSDPEKYWIFKQDINWNAVDILEKPKEFIWDLANVWVYKFSNNIINISKNIWLSSRWEYEITDSIKEFISNNNFKLISTKSNFIDVWYPWDILKASEIFLEKLNENIIYWEIEQNVTIKWKIFLWKNSIIKSWTYIEWNVFLWENVIIWPNAYIRWNTTVLNNSKVWNACEIKNSYIWENTHVSHLCYIWDSVLWNNINIAWWFIRANLRHDKENIKVKIKNDLIDTKLKKFWCIIWDNVKTWINSSTMPWRIIYTNKLTNPWEIIK